MYSDEQIFTGLRAAAAVSGQPMSVTQYDAYAASHNVVGRVRVIQRFGSWNKACVAAGLAVNTTQRTYKKKWSTETVLPHVADYLGSTSTPSYSGYGAWAQETDGAPSPQTVRNVLGSWSVACERATATK